MAQVPAFISTDFALEVFLKMGGKGCSSDIHAFFKENYSKEEYYNQILITRLNQLRSYHIIGSKYDKTKREMLYFLTKEGEEFVTRHKTDQEKIKT